MKKYESEEQIRAHFPLHYFVWNNDFDRLKKYIRHYHRDIEKLDPRGRSPLMLAATLDYRKCAKILMNYSALVNASDSSGFNVLHETVTTKDREYLYTVCERKRRQNQSMFTCIPQMLARIAQTSDFYVEMKWDFSSWLPMMSSFMPTDTYKIYKSGSNLRIDFSLIGVKSGEGIGGTPKWIRGSKSYIFVSENGETSMKAIDHERRRVCEDDYTLNYFGFPDRSFLPRVDCRNEVRVRLSNPIETVFIDTDQIIFERARTGLIFSSDKTETIEGFNCDVYNSVNAQLVQKCRFEHLSGNDKFIAPGLVRSSVASFMGLEEKFISNPLKGQVFDEPRNPYKISMLDYFNVTDPEKDIGLPREMIVRTYKIPTSVSMCEEYPLSLSEQILPILNLLAVTSSHFLRVRDFIQSKIPPGFPVKIDIPLFHFLTAHITFSNVFGFEKPVSGVKTIYDNNKKPKCIITREIFNSNPDYKHVHYKNDPKYNSLSTKYDFDYNQYEDYEEKDDFQKILEMSLIDFKKTKNNQKTHRNQQEKSSIASSPDNDDEFEDAVQSLDENSSTNSDKQMLEVLEQSKTEYVAEQAGKLAKEEAEIELAIKQSLQDQ